MYGDRPLQSYYLWLAAPMSAGPFNLLRINLAYRVQSFLSVIFVVKKEPRKII